MTLSMAREEGAGNVRSESFVGGGRVEFLERKQVSSICRVTKQN
jgi:hypothetical protein